MIADQAPPLGRGGWSRGRARGRVIEWLGTDHRRAAIRQELTRRGQPPAAELETKIALAKRRLLRPAEYKALSR